ncbi:MAG TPA: hypothetical protein VMI75_22590, partial [Polyangiaceae bacterium]|nr:hypothetical protein [Polyangiaceae bacterium]
MVSGRSMLLLGVVVVAACGSRSQLETPGPSRDAGDSSDAAPEPTASATASADAQPPPPCTGGVVVDSATSPWFLALDATDLYFIDEGDPSVAADGSIGRCPKATGCAGESTETVVGGMNDPVGFALDDTHL